MTPNVNMSYSADIFRSTLLTLATDIVWKNSSQANLLESNTDPYLTELFMMAKRNRLNFEVIQAFNEDTIRGLGGYFTDSQIAAMCADKNLIPVQYRDQAVRLFTEWYTKKDLLTGKYINYREENNYYRMINGIPDIGDTEFIYNTKNSKWPKDIPIHNMMIADRIEIESSGYLDELIAKYPDKKYLRYIGKKCIDIYSARAADRFDILWMNYAGDEKIQQDFRATYNRNKYVITATYYSDAFRKSSDLYDNFMAMAILFMTLQTMNYQYLDVDITRDFYDTESLRYVYDSYGVPFYSEIPLEYHTRIVKNINKLLSYKGSTQVFFDLFAIFDLGAMDIYSYYLRKTHRFNPDGTPVFAYKEDGTMDTREMYDIAFSKVKLYDDPALAISDSGNDVKYESLIATDPYWVDDKDLRDKLFDEEYNYAETKYIGIQTIFDLLKMTYENAYFFKMIQDNKDIMDNINIKWNITNTNVSLFDFFIYLGALYCRKFGYEGLISSEFPIVSKMLGYNFEESYQILHDTIMNDPTLSKDNKLISLVTGMGIRDLASVNTAMGNITALREYLANKFYEAKTRKEFFAYRNLYDTLLTSELMEETFKKTDGTIAESFVDMLTNTAPTLYNRYNTIPEDTVDNEIKIVISQLEKTLPNVKNLQSALGQDTNGLIESLFKILNFFKSGKSELVGYNIVYMLSTRGANFLKMLDEVHAWETWGVRFDSELELNDIVEMIFDLVKRQKDFQWRLMDESTDTKIKAELKDQFDRLTDLISRIIITMLPTRMAEVEFNDFILSFATASVLMSTFKPADQIFLAHEDIWEAKWKTLVKDQFDKFVDKFFYDLSYKVKYHVESLYLLRDKIHLIIDRIEGKQLNMGNGCMFKKDDLIWLISNIFIRDSFQKLFMTELTRFFESRFATVFFLFDEFLVALLEQYANDDMLIQDFEEVRKLTTRLDKNHLVWVDNTSGLTYDPQVIEMLNRYYDRIKEYQKLYHTSGITNEDELILLEKDTKENDYSLLLAEQFIIGKFISRDKALDQVLQFTERFREVQLRKVIERMNLKEDFIALPSSPYYIDHIFDLDDSRGVQEVWRTPWRYAHTLHLKDFYTFLPYQYPIDEGYDLIDDMMIHLKPDEMKEFMLVKADHLYELMQQSEAFYERFQMRGILQLTPPVFRVAEYLLHPDELSAFPMLYKSYDKWKIRDIGLIETWRTPWVHLDTIALHSKINNLRYLTTISGETTLMDDLIHIDDKKHRLLSKYSMGDWWSVLKDQFSDHLYENGKYYDIGKFVGETQKEKSIYSLPDEIIQLPVKYKPTKIKYLTKDKLTEIDKSPYRELDINLLHAETYLRKLYHYHNDEAITHDFVECIFNSPTIQKLFNLLWDDLKDPGLIPIRRFSSYSYRLAEKYQDYKSAHHMSYDLLDDIHKALVFPPKPMIEQYRYTDVPIQETFNYSESTTDSLSLIEHFSTKAVPIQKMSLSTLMDNIRQEPIDYKPSRIRFIMADNRLVEYNQPIREFEELYFHHLQEVGRNHIYHTSSEYQLIDISHLIQDNPSMVQMSLLLTDTIYTSEKTDQRSNPIYYVYRDYFKHPPVRFEKYSEKALLKDDIIVMPGKTWYIESTASCFDSRLIKIDIDKTPRRISTQLLFDEKLIQSIISRPVHEIVYYDYLAQVHLNYIDTNQRVIFQDNLVDMLENILKKHISDYPLMWQVLSNAFSTSRYSPFVVKDNLNILPIEDSRVDIPYLLHDTNIKQIYERVKKLYNAKDVRMLVDSISYFLLHKHRFAIQYTDFMESLLMIRTPRNDLLRYKDSDVIENYANANLEKTAMPLMEVFARLPKQYSLTEKYTPKDSWSELPMRYSKTKFSMNLSDLGLKQTFHSTDKHLDKFPFYERLYRHTCNKFRHDISFYDFAGIPEFTPRCIDQGFAFADAKFQWKQNLYTYSEYKKFMTVDSWKMKRTHKVYEKFLLPDYLHTFPIKYSMTKIPYFLKESFVLAWHPPYKVTEYISHLDYITHKSTSRNYKEFYILQEDFRRMYTYRDTFTYRYVDAPMHDLAIPYQVSSITVYNDDIMKIQETQIEKIEDWMLSMIERYKASLVDKPVSIFNKWDDHFYLPEDPNPNIQLVDSFIEE